MYMTGQIYGKGGALMVMMLVVMVVMMGGVIGKVVVADLEGELMEINSLLSNRQLTGTYIPISTAKKSNPKPSNRQSHQSYDQQPSDLEEQQQQQQGQSQTSTNLPRSPTSLSNTEQYQSQLQSQQQSEERVEDEDQVEDQEDEEGGSSSEDEEDEEEQEEEEDMEDEEEDVPMAATPEKFNLFKSLFSWTFGGEEDPYRYDIFKQNIKKIKQHNSNPQKSYKKGTTPYTALKKTQFQQSYLMQQPGLLPRILAPLLQLPKFLPHIPTDWRSKMTEPKVQGKCGACWAFSVVGVLEAMVRDRGVGRGGGDGDGDGLSTQYLLDCCKVGVNGCRGGWPVSALDFIAENGIVYEDDYPYQAKITKCNQDAQTHHFLDKSKPYLQVKGIVTLQFALLTGPVSVIVDASTWDPLYKSGVFDQCPTEGPFNYNHAVVCAGVNIGGQWLLRNSWGSQWGMDGYMRIGRGNSCGVADMGVLPLFSL